MDSIVTFSTCWGRTKNTPRCSPYTLGRSNLISRPVSLHSLPALPNVRLVITRRAKSNTEVCTFNSSGNVGEGLDHAILTNIDICFSTRCGAAVAKCFKNTQRLESRTAQTTVAQQHQLRQITRVKLLSEHQNDGHRFSTSCWESCRRIRGTYM